MNQQLVNQTVPSGENYPDLSREQEVIARLKASKKESDAELLAQGKKDGRMWAEVEAAAIELERLETALDSGYYGFEEEDSAALFCLLVKPKLTGDPRRSADFWQTVTGHNEDPESVYVQGFATAALEVWEKVKRLL